MTTGRINRISHSPPPRAGRTPVARASPRAVGGRPRGPRPRHRHTPPPREPAALRPRPRPTARSPPTVHASDPGAPGAHRCRRRRAPERVRGHRAGEPPRTEARLPLKTRSAQLRTHLAASALAPQEQPTACRCILARRRRHATSRPPRRAAAPRPAPFAPGLPLLRVRAAGRHARGACALARRPPCSPHLPHHGHQSWAK